MPIPWRTCSTISRTITVTNSGSLGFRYAVSATQTASTALWTDTAGGLQLTHDSFFDTLAVFRPYSRHFPHDAGAFQIGLGVTVLLALRISDALLVVLTGISVASWLHVLSHALDRHIGGRPATDIPGLVLLAALATVAAVARAASTTRDPEPGGTSGR